MAGNYGPEVKAAMSNPGKRPSQVKKGAETPADRLRDERRGIKEGSPQDLKIDTQPGNMQAPPAQVLPPQAPGGPASGGMANPAHAAMAASIAHAILGKGGM